MITLSDPSCKPGFPDSQLTCPGLDEGRRNANEEAYTRAGQQQTAGGRSSNGSREYGVRGQPSDRGHRTDLLEVESEVARKQHHSVLQGHQAVMFLLFLPGLGLAGPDNWLYAIQDGAVVRADDRPGDGPASRRERRPPPVRGHS